MTIATKPIQVMSEQRMNATIRKLLEVAGINVPAEKTEQQADDSLKITVVWYYGPEYAADESKTDSSNVIMDRTLTAVDARQLRKDFFKLKDNSKTFDNVNITKLSQPKTLTKRPVFTQAATTAQWVNQVKKLADKYGTSFVVIGDGKHDDANSEYEYVFAVIGSEDTLDAIL